MTPGDVVEVRKRHGGGWLAVISRVHTPDRATLAFERDGEEFTHQFVQIRRDANGTLWVPEYEGAA
jgi:hypothetical protein